jgi:hypothetical protein
MTITFDTDTDRVAGSERGIAAAGPPAWTAGTPPSG